jgi:Mrp family chromosome partitioning ATPase
MKPDPRVPAAFAEMRTDIARFWSALPYERGAKDGLKIACMACGDAEPGRVAAALALGLALHGGERVAYVAAAVAPSWLKARLGLDARRGWSDVVAGKVAATEVGVPTGIVGLDHFEFGEERAGTAPVPGPAFLAFLDELSRHYRFVIVELPSLEIDPAGRSVLGAVDGVELVVRSGCCTKTEFRATMLAVTASGCRLLGCILQAPVPAPAKAAAATAAV